MSDRSQILTLALAAMLSLASLATLAPVAGADHVTTGGASLNWTSGMTAQVRFQVEPSGQCCGGSWSFSLGDGGHGSISDGIDNGAYMGDESGTIALSDGRSASYTRMGPNPVTVDVTFDYSTNGTFHFQFNNCCPDASGSFTIIIGSGGSDNDADGWWTPSDCDDGNPAINPGAWDEPNNGVDEDCNGYDTYDPCYPNGCTDADGDGWHSQYDCNDYDASIYPGAYDTPGDGIDQDCDGMDATMPIDNDGDGWDSSYDCNDYDATIYPGAYDTPGDGIDQDCDGMDATMPIDNDGDGWDSSYDCNDHDPSIHPGAQDPPGDGIDQNCDGDDGEIPPFSGYLWASRQASSQPSGWVWDQATFGVRHGATHGYDADMESPEPPTSPAGEHIRAYFHYPANAESVQALSTSYHGPSQHEEFSLVVEWSNLDPSGTVNIEWWSSDFSSLPARYSVLLLDGNQTIDMRGNSSYNWTTYSFPVSSAAGSHAMRILVTDAVQTNIYLGSGWNLIGLPVTPFDPSVAAIFGSAVDAVYAWDGVGYVAVQTLAPGVGYWAHNPGGWSTVPVYGRPVRDTTLELMPGWNLVGAPYGFTALPPTPSHVSTTLWAWGGGGYYSNQGWMWQGQGYWMYSHEQGASIPLTPMRAPQLEDVLAPTEVAIGEFEMPFAVTAANGQRDRAHLAARTGATDGYEGELDVAEPPRASGGAWVQAFVVGASGMELDTSVVAPVSGAAHSLRVEHAGPAGEVTLFWDGAELPQGYVVELVDGETRIDMRAKSSYTWSAPAGDSARALTVTLRAEDAPVCLVEVEGDCLAALPFDPMSRLSGLILA